jgi:glycine hydroxymethyltransferase
MLAQIDPQIAKLIAEEEHRQNNSINLIASENYTSEAVRQASGSVLTDKYAEGYAGKRYYGGCQFVDQVEELAILRCKQLFSAEHVNVQPHSGSQANMAAYLGLLNLGDTIMGMRLSEGGHLTHGHNVSFSGKLYRIVSYGVNPETELLDYDEILQIAQTHKPKLIVCGASAYSRTIDFAKFGEIAKSVGAYLMADIAHIAGLVATGLHPNPFPHADIVTSTTHKTLRGPRGGLIMCKAELADKIDKAVMPGIQGGPFMQQIAAKAVAFNEALRPDFKIYQQQILDNTQTLAQEFEKLGYRVVAGGTDNHLFMLDLRPKNITGVACEKLLQTVDIYLNRNTIPFDPEKPWITSGIRLGTPALTTKGFKPNDMRVIANLIDQTISNRENQTVLAQIKHTVQILCAKTRT